MFHSARRATGIVMLVAGMNAHANSVPRALRPEYVPGEIIVAMDSPTALAGNSTHTRYARGMKRIGGERDRGIEFRRIELQTGVSVAQALAAYRGIPGVRAASPNYLKYPAYTPNDALGSTLWALNNTAQAVANPTYAANNPGSIDSDIDAPEAWDVVRANAQTIVAIVDAGVDYTHPDLAAAMWDAGAAHFNGAPLPSPYHGYDFANSDVDPYPVNTDHGTHVAGIVAASGDNGIGISGVAYGARLMALKVFPDIGGGATNADIIAAINYAVENGAQIINLSVSGGGAEDAVLTAAIKHAVDAGVLIVSAAGNDAHNNDSVATWPGNYSALAATRSGTISVMASDQADRPAAFSNYGAYTVAVAAPGTNVLSTITGRRTVQAETGGQFADNTAASCVNNEIACFDATIFNGASTDCSGPACRWGWQRLGSRFILQSDTASTRTDQYLGGTNGTITTQPIDVGLTHRLVLRYSATWDLRCDSDYVDVQLWTGSFWKTLPAPRFNVNETRDGSCASTHTHTGHMASLYGAQPMAYDISEYASNRLKVRFVYVSANGDAATTVAHGFQLWDLTLDVQADDYSNAYGVKSGTSMAAPMVSGIAALIHAYRPEYRAPELRRAILNGGDLRDTVATLTASARRANAYGALFAPQTPIAESGNGMVPASIQPATTQLAVSDGGGGCSVSRSRRAFDPTLLLLFFAALLRRTRRTIFRD